MEISEKALKFIQEHAKDDTNALRLKFRGKSEKMDFSTDFAILQIEARQKAQKKIPTFLDIPLFVFPDILVAEQATNETVAEFHASLLKPDSNILDLTAGLGIDDITFAKHGMRVTSCEISEERTKALQHNIEILGLENRINVINVDSMAYASTCEKHFDVVFADPARRTASGKRVHALADCQPDILGGLDMILGLTDRLIIKSSPLLDLTLIRDTVDHLAHIHVVCLKGECKEVLIEINKNSSYTGISVADLDNHGIKSFFECHHSPAASVAPLADRSTPADYRYLYEPNAGVMKTNAWGELAVRFGDIWKADVNTHLFLSDSLFPEFPGRILRIEKTADKQTLKGLKGKKCNVAARNHPLSAPEIAKRHSLIPGGDEFLYAFRYKGKPLFLTAKQL